MDRKTFVRSFLLVAGAAAGLAVTGRRRAAASYEVCDACSVPFEYGDWVKHWPCGAWTHSGQACVDAHKAVCPSCAALYKNQPPGQDSPMDLPWGG